MPDTTSSVTTEAPQEIDNARCRAIDFEQELGMAVKSRRQSVASDTRSVATAVATCCVKDKFRAPFKERNA